MTEPAGTPSDPYDLVIIGGGINGTGIARDAAGRGLSVLLAERDDLAAHTSSASTKLIHGGLRYLEYYEFRLVREALQERERLLGIAPHIIWPLRFVLPQPKGGRPGWMIRIGLWLYDHLGGRQRLPSSQAVSLADPRWSGGLNSDIRRGFAYSDCWVDDARMVVLNAMDAAERGATILPGMAVTSARVEGDLWQVELAPNPDIPGAGARASRTVCARAVVNAAGPWVASMLGEIGDAAQEGGIRLVKGSHIIVPRMYPGEHAFILQNPDGRILFTIPYEGQFTLVGTTDLLVNEAERAAPRISTPEIAYLCDSVNAYFTRPITPDDIVASYSGVRPLYDDGEDDAKAITRDYVLKLGRKQGPQILSVFGGKLTTYRRLAEHALEQLAPFLPAMGKGWTDRAPLPGGDLPDGDFPAFLSAVCDRYPFLPLPVATRMAHAYGTRIDAVLGTAQGWNDLGEDFGAGLTAAEVDYLCDHEWARTPRDILWRRTKLALILPAGNEARLAHYLESRRSTAG